LVLGIPATIEHASEQANTGSMGYENNYAKNVAEIVHV